MTTRLSVNINETTAREIHGLTALKGINMTEVVRRAIALYFAIVTKILAGYTVEFVKQDEGKREELVLL